MISNRIGTGRPVGNLQSFLRNISQEYEDVLSVVPDGIFGPQTTASVKSFQRQFGMEPTGTVDNDTWDLLVQVNDTVVRNGMSPDGIQIFHLSQTAMQEGCAGDVICLLQVMLNALSHRYYNLTETEVNGVLDPATIQNVRIMQPIIGVSPTGELDKPTWNGITSSFNSLRFQQITEEQNLWFRELEQPAQQEP